MSDANLPQKPIINVKGLADEFRSELGVVQVEKDPVRGGHATSLVLDLIFKIDGDAGVARPCGQLSQRDFRLTGVIAGGGWGLFQAGRGLFQAYQRQRVRTRIRLPGTDEVMAVRVATACDPDHREV